MHMGIRNLVFAIFMGVASLPLAASGSELGAAPSLGAHTDKGFLPESSPKSSTGAPSSKKWSLGLGWPVLMGRWSFAEDYDAEVRYAAGDAIGVIAGRGYWNFLKYEHLTITGGVEAGYISFDAEIYGYKGNGYELQPFVGVEAPIWRGLSLLVDIGPTFINVASEGTSQMTMEWVVNTGIYYRLF